MMPILVKSDDVSRGRKAVTGGTGVIGLRVGHPGFHGQRPLGSLYSFLHHSLVYMMYLSPGVCKPSFKVL